VHGITSYPTTKRFGSCEFVERAGKPADSEFGKPNTFVPSETIWVRHDEIAEWELGVEFTVRAEVSGLAVRAPFDRSFGADWHQPVKPRLIPPGGLTVRTMRAIRWAEVEQAARHWLRIARAFDVSDASAEYQVLDKHGEVIISAPLYPGGGVDGDRFNRAVASLHAARIPPDRPRPGPKGRSDREMAVIASQYVHVASDPATSRSPIRALAERLGYSASTVRGIVAGCRSRGLLTSTTQGRACGGLTDYATAILDNETEQQ